MRKLLFTAVALALCSSVNADPLTAIQSVSTGSTTRSISDTTPNSAAQSSNVTKNLSFDQFVAGTGVLVGVYSGLTFNSGTFMLSAAGTKGAGTGALSFGSEATIHASSNLPGLPTFGAINQPLSNSCTAQDTCFPGGITDLSNNSSLNKTDTSWLNASVQAGSSSLDNYVGTGKVASMLTITPSVSITQEQRITGETARTEVSGLIGSQSLTYSYLRHANASFAAAADKNALDPNNLTPGHGLTFSVFNFGDASTAKLDFAGLQCVSGDCGAFNVSMASFQDLLAGGSIAGNASLTTTVAGSYEATYTLLFSDDTAVGATASHLTNALTLGVQGSVAPVPEPSTWAMLSLGLIGLAWRCRRKS